MIVCKLCNKELHLNDHGGLDFHVCLGKGRRMDILIYGLYCLGSLCFLAGSLISLISKLGG